MAAKYILDPSGDVKSVDGKNESSDITAKAYSKVAKDSIYSNSSKTTPTYTQNISFVSDNEKISVLQDNSFGDGSETIGSYRSFNDSDNLYASEFEMLTGYANLDNEQFIFNRQTSITEFIGQVIGEITIIEAIIEANKLLQGEDNVEENYSFRYGNYTIPSLDITSEYLFKVLNYPKEKVSLTERLSSFFLGFGLWLKPDNFIDIDEITKEISGGKGTEYQNLIDAANDILPVFNIPLLDTVSAFVLYLVESLLTINSSLDKRIKLLFNKFAMEKIWDNQELFKHKGKSIEEFDFFRKMDFYYFRFYIERIHVGSKMLKYQLQKKTPLPLRTKESPFTRLGSSSFQNIEDIKVGIDKHPYQWSAKDSKSKDTLKHEQSTRLRALPQGLLLHDSMISAILLNNNQNTDILSIGEDLLQNFSQQKENRLSSDLVKEIENHLEAEYMPFYLHDIRTNEVISMHAFIDTISDSFSPEFTSVSGFGRIDDVKSYVKTTRNVNVTFKLVSTSQSDHDLMWYQINKIVAMCYPQWSDALPAYKENDSKELADFKYPFTQVPTASPLVRLRVGDVIKSNYSRTNLSRLHGIGSRKVIKDVNLSESDTINVNNTSASDVDGLVKYIQTSPNKTRILLPGMYRDNAFSGEGVFAFSDFEMGYYNIKSPVAVEKIEDASSIGKSSVVKIKVVEPNHPANGKVLSVDKRSIINKKSKFNSIPKDSPLPPLLPPVPGIDAVLKGIENSINEAANKLSLQNQTNDIMSPTNGDKSNNPITKSYESGMSRGLAGFITNLNVDYNEFVWETSRVGSKAPMMVTITMAFAPIHDIPPGLDHNGMLRAPVYNVGRINNEMFGDPHDGDQGLNYGRKAVLDKLKDML